MMAASSSLAARRARCQAGRACRAVTHARRCQRASALLPNMHPCTTYYRSHQDAPCSATTYLPATAPSRTQRTRPPGGHVRDGALGGAAPAGEGEAGDVLAGLAEQRHCEVDQRKYERHAQPAHRHDAQDPRHQPDVLHAGAAAAALVAQAVQALSGVTPAGRELQPGRLSSGHAAQHRALIPGVHGPRGRSYLQRLRAPVVDGEPKPARPAAAGARSGACRSRGRAASQRGWRAPAARRSDWREHDPGLAPTRAAPRALPSCTGVRCSQRGALGGRVLRGALYLVRGVIAVDVVQPGRLLAHDDGHRRQPRRPEQEQRNDDRQQLRAGARPVRRKAAVNASAAEQRRFVEEPALPTRPRAEEPVMHPPQRTPPVVNTGPCTTLASRPPAGLRASASRRTTSQDPGRRRRFSKVPRPPARSQAPALCL